MDKSFFILSSVVGLKLWTITGERILEEKLKDFSFQNC
jgi:hypothetical protein